MSIPKELLDATNYPEAMFMDMYGDASQSWDRLNHKNVNDVIFRVKYVRADIAANMVLKALKGNEK